MRRKLHIAGKGPDDWIRIADASGKVVCTLPRTEQRLARFIVRCVNWFGIGLRSYDRSDWWMEKNRSVEPTGIETVKVWDKYHNRWVRSAKTS